jgi:hypothetical protein
MNEHQIRVDIRARLPRFFNQESGAKLVEEMEICLGSCRVDMAVIGDQLIGIEIKGPDDKLSRLPEQVTRYSKCFDQVVLVVHERMAVDAMHLIPEWWGVVVAASRNGENTYYFKRRPAQNVGVDASSVLSLLWRPEIATLFKEFFGTAPSASISKRGIRDRLLTEAPLTQLKNSCAKMLRAREDWRAVPI